MIRLNLYVILSMALLSMACGDNRPSKKVIAVSHSGIIGQWGEALYQELEFEAALIEADYEFRFVDAGGDVAQQRTDIQKLIDDKVDALIVFPSYPDSLADLLNLAYESGIKLVIADRTSDKISSDNFVGSDDYEIGRLVGDYVVGRSGQRTSVLEVLGPAKSYTSTYRHRGFSDVIRATSNVTIDHVLYGNWSGSESFRVADSLFATGYVPQIVFSHNDIQAYNVYLACKKHRIAPVIIGIDGMSIPGGGVDMVLGGYIDATFYNPTAAKESVKNAIALLNGKRVEKEEWLGSFLIDSSNALAIKRQFKLLSEQNETIRKQREHIADQKTLLNDQRIVVLVALSAVLMLVFLVVWTIVSLVMKMRLVNTIQTQKKQIEAQLELQRKLIDDVNEKSRLLKEQKDEIETQRDSIYAQNQELAAYGTEMEQLVETRTAELKLALEKARESDRLKTAFLSNLSHEIRTPLNAIIGFSDLFCQPDREFEERMGLQKVIKRNSQELLDLIERVIDLSMLTTGQIIPKMKQCPLGDILAKAYQNAAVQISEGPWHHFEEVELRMDEPASVTVRTDCEMVMKIIGHLLQNALKHTHKGSVVLGCEIIQGGAAVRVFVKDSGVGIPDDYKNVVFDMFRKVESHSLVLYRGAGMGLTIVKHLSELMGFQIKFESKVGQGSLFWFDLDVYDPVF
jgi:signal transduction histidine kinase/ABC-type xylose transport system substrate-binding protein